MKNLGAAALAVLMLGMSACASDEPADLTVELATASDVEFEEIGIDEVRDAATALVGYTSDLGIDMIRSAKPAANQVVSPWGAMLTLQMLRAGAGGNTAAELDSVLGVADTDAVAALIGQLDQVSGDPGGVDLKNPPSPPVFHQASGIFIDDSLTVGDDYLEVLARSFGTGIYPVDFSVPETESALNKWISVNTGGEISQAPTEYSTDTVISVLSTVFLAAAWQQPFSPESTSPADFTTGDGSVAEVDTMHKTLDVPLRRGAGWTAVQLPYSQSLAMQILLPDNGSDPDALLNGTALADANSALRAGPESSVEVSLPRWDITGQVDLKSTLEGRGVHDLFTDAADLTAISDQLVVTAVAQNSSITVGEKGTVAASATQVDIGVTSLPPEPADTFIADRPFVFQIVDTATGLPLFLGIVARPDNG
ncbi:serpin family protein [Nocardia sp. 348MFTsu5.1]|uniref:serpin family protein n=1 Tax=Nocardia sp. 348MFTsu5.1 TaxID=1172185 RepID=UPI0003813E0D|nr:serpin family protein [Nocardia sp. 348MFTsu5.1]